MISCLMVTRATETRLGYVKRSIADYCAQSHADRELVVVINRARRADIAALAAHVEALDRADIRLTMAPDDLTLGALRNRSVDIAAGDMICQWDDDDLYHPERLERQHAALTEGGCDAVYLQELLHYNPGRSALYLANWRGTAFGGHPGTLMARRSTGIRYPELGADATKGEDSVAARALIARGGVGFLRGAPHLTLYVSHGENTWAGPHHDMLLEKLATSTALLIRREASLRAGLAPFGFPAGSIDVVGDNGIAFRI